MLLCFGHAAAGATAAPCAPVPRAGLEEEAWQGGTSDCTAGELAQLMYWLMVRAWAWAVLGSF